jgi:hypothetical protein
MALRIFLLLILLPGMALSQSNFAPLNEDYYHLIERYEIKSGQNIPSIFTSLKPYKRSAIVAFADSAKQEGMFTSASDAFNYKYLMNDNWEWSSTADSVSKKPFLKHFYKKPSDFYSYHNKDFDLHINPVIYIGAGQDNQRDERLFINTRGVEVRGMVDEKLGFYTYLTDNQTVLPRYVWRSVDSTAVIPHEGFWKEYSDQQGADFLQARGYITYDATKHVNLQLGHDRFFVGNGYRSLIFSDYAPPSMYLSMNVKVWKVNYLFRVTQMTADVDSTESNLGGLKAASGGYPSKFNAFHHVSINIGKKLNVGLFESVIFTSDDPDGSGALRLDYFNPIIFYRAIEQQNGSSDNVLLGMDVKWNALRSLQLYGQLLVDEFVIGNIRAGNGWWANKFGIQLGGKYVDAFTVKNLDLQGEINIVRPYTYSHGSRFGSYSNYRQPIAHPLGANFKEIIGIARYQPLPRLTMKGKLIIVQTGRDYGDENWGSDILKDNTTHVKNEGNTIGQGLANDIFFGTFTASWQFRHNVFVEGTVVLRNSKSDVRRYDYNSTISSLALRWNIPQRHYEF